MFKAMSSASPLSEIWGPLETRVWEYALGKAPEERLRFVSCLLAPYWPLCNNNNQKHETTSDGDDDDDDDVVLWDRCRCHRTRLSTRRTIAAAAVAASVVVVGMSELVSAKW